MAQLIRTPAFISFAAEDDSARDLFIGQGKHSDTPWSIADWSLHEPFSEKWRTQTRPRIKRCGVLIQLVGTHTYRAEGALWETKVALEEGVPAFGVWISKTGRGPLPEPFKANNVIDWTWEGIGDFIRRAVK